MFFGKMGVYFNSNPLNCSCMSTLPLLNLIIFIKNEVQDIFILTCTPSSF